MNWSKRPSTLSLNFHRLRQGFSGLFFAILLSTICSIADAKPKVHVVYAGQRLGSIAKRYNVSVEQLCQANNITQRDAIHPGQKLVIPGTDDGKGNDKKDVSSTSKAKAEPKGDAPDIKKPLGKTRVHLVAKGHTLAAIAGRYAITVGALSYANDLNRNATLSVGDKIIIPHKSDKGGAYARKQRDRGDFADPPASEKEAEPELKNENRAHSSINKSWEPYVKPAWRRGYIKMRRFGRYWEGYVIGPKGEVLGQASNKINFVLGAKSNGPQIESKLIRLIASVSDQFGGRELRIVSGYRTKSFVAASQHKKGRALDFSIPGIPNEALRDYLRTLDEVGVGYYPNSSFVHIDVRGYNSYWIDYAGPGEAPRKAAKGKSSAKNKQKTTTPSEHDHDADAPPEGYETEDTDDTDAPEEHEPSDDHDTGDDKKSEGRPNGPKQDKSSDDSSSDVGDTEDAED